MLAGYIRVSSDSERQSTDSQRDALLAAGVDLVTGLGFATTTKMAHFARLDRGPAIFDANVSKATVDPSGPWGSSFPRTRSLLGSTNFHAKGVLNYSNYVEEAARLARRHNTTLSGQ
ncbi:hypothetical protein [Bradyrhizobium sp. WSM471]|uniref:hypothetical protein n=1 Tax=Bradyrhizobium sp. WSM471 TaxID=319017 RepID=UPI00055F8B93